MDRAALVRPEIEALASAPHEYLRRFLFDTITFDPRALAFLIDRVGADRVMLGSDAPFDMRDPDPLSTLESAVRGERARAQVAVLTVQEAFRWEGATLPVMWASREART
jgi:aminocarboxymuconate-semialdehyde decarboxylase